MSSVPMGPAPSGSPNPVLGPAEGAQACNQSPPTMITAVVLHQIRNHLLAGPSFDRELP